MTELWDTLPKISYKQAIADKQQCGEINLHILNASKFLNAALTIYRREILKLTGQAYIKRTLTPYDQLDAKEQEIISHIREVESVFLTAILDSQTESTWDSNLRYKRALELIRDKVQERLDAIKARYGETCVPFNPEQSQAVRETYEAIARELKEFLGSLIHECEQILGRPPCAYSVIGLGSLAKEEMTPYSDIEFAILIAEDLPEIKSYCYSISMLLNLKIIALGETSIPNSLFGINFDDITRSGLQLDLGGKTPLGREDQNYELIQTPVAMAGYTTEETFNRCKLLPIEMVTFTHICGDVSLTETYCQKVMEELDREVPAELADIAEQLANPMGTMRGESIRYYGDIERATHVLHRDNGTHFSLLEITQLQETPEEANVLGTADFPPTRVSQVLSVRKQRALRLLKNDIERFGPRLGLYINEGKLYEVKHDIYRLPNTIIDDLALYYAVPGNSSWQRIDALCQAKYLHPAAAERLKNVFSMATELRLKTYQHYRAQQETFSALFKLVPVEPNSRAVVSSSSQQEHYKLTTGQMAILTEAYKTLLPLCEMAKLFVHSQGRMMIFKYTFLYDKRAKTAGQIAARLCDYQTAANYFREALRIEPESAELRNDLGVSLLKLTEPQGAIESFQVSLAAGEKQYGENHLSVAILLTNLGAAYGLSGDARKQKDLLEHALRILEAIYDSDCVAMVSLFDNLATAYGSLGNAQKQKDLSERALRIAESSYGSDHVEVAKTLRNLANAYDSLGDAQNQRIVLERALRINESFYGADHVEVAKTLGSLAIAYGSLGDAQKQKDLLERVLRIFETFYGANHVEVAVALNSLATAYGSLGNAQKQKDFLERALRIFETFYGTAHVDVAKTLGNLAIAYGRLGDTQKQRDLLERALRIFEPFYGTNHVEVARILGNLAIAYGSLGDTQKSKVLLERVLRIFETFYGTNHVEVAKILENLAIAYGSLGDVQKQKDLLERTLLIKESFYGADHTEVAKTLGNLATAYGSLGEVQKQKNFLERALRIEESFFGVDHVEVARTLANLGNAYGDLGDTQKLKDLLERALQIFETFYGTNHVEVAIILNNLGTAYGSLGKYHKQKDLLERALRILETFYGTNHVEVTSTLENLAITYGSLGDAQKRKDFLERALRINESFYGPNHVKVARTLANLGIAYGTLGDAQKQKVLLERALRIFEPLYGLNHVEVAIILTNLGNAYGSLGDVQKQKDLLERALRTLETFYGINHVEVVGTLENLGTAYGSLGKYQKSKDLLERALQIKVSFYGTDHVDIARTLGNLAIAYGRLGDTQKQRDLLERALRIKESFYGLNHVEVAITLNNLAITYGDLGDEHKKKDLLGRALRIFEPVYGTNHVAVANTYFNLGMAYVALGNSIEARKKIWQAFFIFLSHYGPSHEMTKRSATVGLKLLSIDSTLFSFLAGDEHKKPPTSRPDSRCHDSSQETCHSPTPLTSSSSFFSGRAGVPPAQEFSVSSAATQYDIHPGLQYQPMLGDGNCLYRAVSYHLGHGEDVSFLRSIVAANLEHNKTQYADFIPLRDGQSIQDYIAEVGNTSAWATEVEINILMRLLDRPIVVIGSDGMIRNKEAVNQYSGKEPIFVFYNGGDEQGSGKPGHYDVLLLRDGYDGRSILSEMRNHSTSQTSSLP